MKNVHIRNRNTQHPAYMRDENIQLPLSSSASDSSGSSQLAADHATLHLVYDISQAEFGAGRRIIGTLLAPIRKLLSRLLRPILSRQIQFNAAQARITASVKDELALVKSQIMNSGLQLTKLGTQLAESRSQLTELCSQVAEMKSQLDLQTGVLGLQGKSSSLDTMNPKGELAPACFRPDSSSNWYRPTILGPSTVANYAMSRSCVEEVMQVLAKLKQDEVMDYLLQYYKTGLDRFGEHWWYADIATVLVAITKLMRPARYLEIGVFHGRSMSMVGAFAPECELVGFDIWDPAYVLGNPGPDLVYEQLKQVGHSGSVTLISGDSHSTVPAYFAAHPAERFDLVTVDGDHSYAGATQDLKEAIKFVKVGGFLVFDDICCPGTEHLYKVWCEIVESDPSFVTWSFSELGNGVAIAMKQA
jgi:predicted O-methyltransferase YrrM